MQGAFYHKWKINLLECSVGYETFVVGMSICPCSVLHLYTYIYVYIDCFSIKSLKKKQNEA